MFECLRGIFDLYEGLLVLIADVFEVFDKGVIMLCHEDYKRVIVELLSHLVNDHLSEFLHIFSHH